MQPGDEVIYHPPHLEEEKVFIHHLLKINGDDYAYVKRNLDDDFCFLVNRNRLSKEN